VVAVDEQASWRACCGCEGDEVFLGAREVH